MLIYELDADVLRLVAASVAQSRKVADILAFAITCRHVYKAARPFIPSCLNINILSPTFLLLRRTLIEDESYGLGVHSLRVTPCKTKHELTQKDMRDFFQLIPNLRTLLAYDSSLSIIPIILSPETLFRSSLQRLFLGCEIKPTASELFEIVHLPKIQHLEVQGFSGFEGEDLPSSKAPDSKLKHLKFVGGQISRQTLSSLIVASPPLATLVCRTPLDEPSRKGVYPSSAFISVPLSPISILPTLAPISQTLVKLDLSTSDQEWIGHDGTRLDLTSFTKMRHLCASAELLVAPHVLGVSRGGLFKLLPPSLRNFRLDFGFSIGVLFSTHRQIMDKAGYQRFVDNTLDPSSYEWIVELAHHKDECFKQLKHIRLYDRTRELHSLFSHYEWDPPKHVEELFKGANIELEVWVRGPKKRD